MTWSLRREKLEEEVLAGVEFITAISRATNEILYLQVLFYAY